MNRGVYALLVAQFLTAFADNAILFTAIAMVLHTADTAPWYVPAMQAAFLVAFVALAPWVGAFADSRPKAQVLLIGNVLKGAGVALMLAGVDPIAAYALVGVGAAVYGPAKYGILPEMVAHTRLVQANGWIEGSTIVAIILGTVVGARVADSSITAALLLAAACYVLSLTATLLIPRTQALHAAQSGVRHFGRMMRALFASQRARFVMLGSGLFWAAAAVLRLVLVSWAPLVLATQSAADIAELTLALAVGIVIGAILVPRLIPIERLRRARLAAYLMGLGILALTQVQALLPAYLVLVYIGVCGGLFMVPVNAALQEIGHRTVGSGGAVALQNFFENLAMLTTVGVYTYAAGQGAHPVGAIAVVGLLVLLATFLVSMQLPPDPAPADAPADEVPGEAPGADASN
ncbi:lysophospholipid transporter LplT [Ectothiorhodospiraceae bacterium 2226]|nr:lysophospholipid transporter LplT [Ectothiorhodospiraceae bacterium 2226]